MGPGMAVMVIKSTYNLTVQKEGDVKAFSITAFFPEAKAHIAYQSTTSEAAEMEKAISRGLQEIRKRDGIKGKQLSEVRLTVKQIERARE